MCSYPGNAVICRQNVGASECYQKRILLKCFYKITFKNIHCSKRLHSSIIILQDEELHLLATARDQRSNTGHQYIPSAPTVPQHHPSHHTHHAHAHHAHPHSQAAAAAAAAAALNSTPPVLLQEPAVHPNPHDLYVSELCDNLLVSDFKFVLS